MDSRISIVVRAREVAVGMEGGIVGVWGECDGREGEFVGRVMMEGEVMSTTSIQFDLQV
jgi:hypothetical protein